MQSTIALFRKMYDSLPPLFPAETKRKMNHALSHLEKDSSITLEEIEDTMIIFGYESWPWLRAYREFLDLAESRVGEHFLLPKLAPLTLERYDEFKRYGGTLRDLHSGRPINFFSDSERHNFREALIEIQPELREYTNRAVIGVDKDKYLNKIEEFTRVLRSIRSVLDELKNIADAEQDHPGLASEIRARVKSFEHGLCLLAPEPDFSNVANLPEHFAGRRRELLHLRGVEQLDEFQLDQ